MSDSHYYLDLAAAFVRGKLPDAPPLPTSELIAHGREAGLRLHPFRRTQELPRVRKVLGMLRSLGPVDLLDVGSGRGTFLWPLLDAFPYLNVLSIDQNDRIADDLQAIRRGGIDRLTFARMDVTRLALADKSADIVTALEVLEHIPDPPRAVSEIVRVARRFVVVSVPSKPDDNPEHVHLFDRQSVTDLFANAGAWRVTVEGVLNHMIALVRVESP